MKTFWPSNQNKQNFSKLLYSNLKSKPPSAYPIVVSQVDKMDKAWECVKVHDGNIISMPHLHSVHDEADLRVPLHVLDCVKDGYYKILVLTNDTDISVYLLYHLPTFKHHGLEELWTRAGRGDTSRYLPLHILYNKMGRGLTSYPNR